MIKREESKLEKNFTIIGFVICFVIALVFINKGCKIDANIEQNKFVTVGKVYKYSYFKGSHYYYHYYYKQIKYINSYRTGIGEREISINKFYVLKLSTEHPEYSEIDLDQEITDTVEIFKAGFSREDIKNPDGADMTKHSRER